MNDGSAQNSSRSNDHKAEVKAATKAALKWLKLVDDGLYDQSWEEAAESFKLNTPKETWEETLDSLMPQFGSNQSREVFNSRYLTKMPGGAEGEYVMLRFRSSFEKKEDALETVTPVKDGDKWRITGYYIK